MTYMTYIHTHRVLHGILWGKKPASASSPAWCFPPRRPMHRRGHRRRLDAIAEGSPGPGHGGHGGSPSVNHRKTMGKAWEKHGKMEVYPLVMTGVMKYGWMENGRNR